MSQKLDTSPAVIGIDIDKNSFNIIGQNQRGAIVLRCQLVSDIWDSWDIRLGQNKVLGQRHLSRLHHRGLLRGRRGPDDEGQPRRPQEHRRDRNPFRGP